jgi:hypothetical protein
MTTETLLIEQPTAEIPEVAEPVAVPVALEAIRADSRQNPDQYVDETVAPHGGE